MTSSMFMNLWLRMVLLCFSKNAWKPIKACKKFFSALSPWKSVKIYRLGWMGWMKFWWLNWFPDKNNSCQLIWAPLQYLQCTVHTFELLTTYLGPYWVKRPCTYYFVHPQIFRPSAIPDFDLVFGKVIKQ